MTLEFTLKASFPVSAERIYNAWLDSKEHAMMTNSESAVASHEINATYKAHGEYISGKNIELIPFTKIKQTWRSVSFTDSDADSIIEIFLEEHEGQTELTLIHSLVPEKEFHVEKGWVDHYFEPMSIYFKS